MIIKNLFRFFLIIIALLLILAIILYLTFGPVNLTNAKKEIIHFHKNKNATELASHLKKHDFIRSENAFKFLAKISSLDKKLKPGAYKLSSDMDCITILLIISGFKGEPILQKFTIPEGTALEEIPAILNKANILCAPNFVEYIKSSALNDFKHTHNFLNNIPIDSLEGYLFPDTYFIDFETTPKQIVELMLNRFLEVIVPIYNNAKKKKYSLHQYLTLASVIEKECHVAKERSIVAGVFLKRLKIGMPLEADPTVKYAKKEYSKKIVLYRDLKFNSPYNTYLYKGLPPGPICSLGKESFIAVLYPTRTEYLYFVAKGDGSHLFGKTAGEHFRNIATVRKN